MSVYVEKVSQVGDTRDETASGWFHSHDGWFFRGERVRGDGHGDFDRQVVIAKDGIVVARFDSGPWASICATVSARGEDAVTFAAALDFYLGWPATRAEAAHVRSKGAGGPDKGNTIPLCMGHHHEQHLIGIRSFEKRYGLDLKTIAQDLAVRYDREFPVEPRNA